MFQDFPTQYEVTKRWDTKYNSPIVSLLCITYMHRPFILNALHSLITQETTYPFEIVCYDDCSSDGTREIVKAFADRYPAIVNAVLPGTNQYSNSNRYYFDVITPCCKGKYIANCEGDDYWSDTKKIQKQVEFLEANPEYALVYHEIATINQDGKILDRNWLPNYYKQDFSAEEVRLAWCSNQMQSMMYRNLLHKIPNELRNSPTDDVWIVALLGQHGKSKYLQNIKPAMYRQHTGGAFTSLSRTEQLDVQAMNFFWLYKYYRQLGYTTESNVMRLRYLDRCLHTVNIKEILRLVYIRIFKKRSMKLLMSNSSS